jgi:hypothetical protein
MARGAPIGNRNALKHGRFAGEMQALRREVREAFSAAAVLLGHRGGVRSQNPTLLPFVGCDFISSDKRGPGAGPQSKISPREN